MRGRSTVAVVWLVALGAVSCAVDGGGDPVRDAARLFATDAAATDADPATLGAGYVQDRACASCHQSGLEPAGSLAGSLDPVAGTRAYGPNLTPDPDTGLGGWSDAAIARALRDGVDADGEALCVMPRFGDMSDAEAAAIVAYLRSLAPVARTVPDSVCESDGGDAGAVESLALARDAGGLDGHGLDAGGCAARVVINELATEGPRGAGDEFVELYNAGACTVSLAGWRLLYASLVGTAGSTRWTGRATDAIAPGGYVVLAGVGFAGPALGRFAGVRGALSTSGGGVGLFDGAARVDAVGWGSLAANPYVEADPAPAPAPSRSIQRIPDGLDRDDNRRDFVPAAAPTPGGPNH